MSITETRMHIDVFCLIAKTIWYMYIFPQFNTLCNCNAHFKSIMIFTNFVWTLNMHHTWHWVGGEVGFLLERLKTGPLIWASERSTWKTGKNCVKTGWTKNKVIYIQMYHTNLVLFCSFLEYQYHFKWNNPHPPRLSSWTHPLNFPPRPCMIHMNMNTNSFENDNHRFAGEGRTSISSLGSKAIWRYYSDDNNKNCIN